MSKKMRKKTRKRTIIGASGKDYVLVLKEPFYQKAWFWLFVLIIAVIGGVLAIHKAEVVNTAGQTAEPKIVLESEAENNESEPTRFEEKEGEK